MSYFFLWYILTSWIEQKEEKSPFDDVMYHTLSTVLGNMLSNIFCGKDQVILTNFEKKN